MIYFLILIILIGCGEQNACEILIEGMRTKKNAVSLFFSKNRKFVLFLCFRVTSKRFIYIQDGNAKDDAKQHCKSATLRSRGSRSPTKGRFGCEHFVQCIDEEKMPFLCFSFFLKKTEILCCVLCFRVQKDSYIYSRWKCQR